MDRLCSCSNPGSGFRPVLGTPEFISDIESPQIFPLRGRNRPGIFVDSSQNKEYCTACGQRLPTPCSQCRGTRSAPGFCGECGGANICLKCGGTGVERNYHI